MRHTKNRPVLAKPLPQIRIIGGQWRSRKLNFPEADGLRPTPDRVRETLFNWLQSRIPGARCLDLFAGSGALGLEALSRGASHCMFIDIAHPSCQALRNNVLKLACENAQIIQMDTLNWLQQRANAGANNATTDKFDVVFLDPPFHTTLCQEVCQLLIDKDLLNPNAYIYIETEHRAAIDVDWAVHREKTAGQVRYRLYKAT